MPHPHAANTLLRPLAALLRDPRAFCGLFALQVLIVIAAAVLMRNARSGDHSTYWELARGTLQGKYSFWHSLTPYPPDTLRTPGYPIFVALASFGCTSLRTLLLVQAGLYLAAVAIVCRILWRLVPDDLLPRTLFLFVLMPSIQLVYYTALVFPECLLSFLIVAYLDAEIARRHWVICGVLLGAVILVRPIYALYPIVRAGPELLASADMRTATKRAVGVAAVAIALMLPYGAWNQVHFGTFSLMPIEGSAGNIHMGFWQHRLPGKFSRRYWPNFQGRELIPFVSDAESARYFEEYNQEWDEIERQAEPFFTATDRKNQEEFKKRTDLFSTYSQRYTVARARIIARYTWNHIRAEPGYYVATRLYTAFRLWVTGVNMLVIGQPGFLPKVSALYPTLVTLIFLVGGLIVAVVQSVRRRPEMRRTLPIWSLLVYGWLVHVPVSIGSRYTVPLHFAALLLSSLGLSSLIRARIPPGSIEA